MDGKAAETKRNSEDKATHLFVHHYQPSRVSFSKVVSHARRTQFSREQRQRRSNAKIRADYAKSLVGWQTRRAATSPIPNDEDSHKPSKGIVLPRHQHQRALSPQYLARSVTSSDLTSPTNTGLRVDPFNSFPSDNSRTAMHMVDFYIRIWSIYKRGAIDAELNLNTQIDMCWPIALQDPMLFDATLTVSRVAYCLGQRQIPENDTFMLQHKVRALALMRQRMVDAASVVPSEAMIFAVSRMLSVSYMTMDSVAFQTHFAALQQMAKEYMGKKNAMDPMAQVVQSRLRSWNPLFRYRQSQNSLAEKLAQFKSIAPSPMPVLLDETLKGKINALPPGFRELAGSGNLTLNTIELVLDVQDLLMTLEFVQTVDGDTLAMMSAHLQAIRNRITGLLASLRLSMFETQLSHTLYGIALTIPAIYQATQLPPFRPSRNMVPAKNTGLTLAEIAKAFLYLKFAAANISPTHALCLRWCALTLGSACFISTETSPGARQKGHIILVSITERLLPLCEGDRWTPVAGGIQDMFLWPSMLVSEWQQLYIAALQRQRYWENGLGLFRIGMPGNDRIEYMVLRDARGALPGIDEDGSTVVPPALR
jgi:hypothetical protein